MRYNRMRTLLDFLQNSLESETLVPNRTRLKPSVPSFTRNLLFFLLLMSFGNANHISWLGNYDKALEKAKKAQKPMMVLLVKKDCKRCNEVIVEHFINRDDIDELNEKYIAVMVTYEGRVSYPIELFYSTTFPTLFFVDSKHESFLREPVFLSNKI